MDDLLIPQNLSTLPRYTSLIGIGIMLGLAVMIQRTRGVYRAGKIIDVGLAGVIGGVIVARAVHVWVHWTYFQAHTDEITRLRAGGLDWHGAVIGALLAMVLMARMRGVMFRRLLMPMALVLPLVGLMAWWGCYEAQCSYGAEVENLSYHPAWQVWEAPDIFNISAPRYRTQQIGMALSIGLLILAGSVTLYTRRRKRHYPALFGFMVIVFSAGMFMIGDLRGDAVPIIAGLRADQWLDIGVATLGGALFIAYRKPLSTQA